MTHPTQSDDLVKRLRETRGERRIDLGNGQTVSGPLLGDTYIQTGLKEQAADLIEQQAKRIAELEDWNKYLAGHNEQLATKIDELEAARIPHPGKTHHADDDTLAYIARLELRNKDLAAMAQAATERAEKEMIAKNDAQEELASIKNVGMEPVAAPNEATKTAPERIWLGLFTDEEDTVFQDDYEGVCWAQNAFADVNVEYVRADLAASQLAKVQAEQHGVVVGAMCAIEGRCLSGEYYTKINELSSQVALAREALEQFNAPDGELEPIAEKALSTLTTDNAVQQIEARAYEKAIAACNEERVEVQDDSDSAYNTALDHATDAIRKLADQKEFPFNQQKTNE